MIALTLRDYYLLNMKKRNDVFDFHFINLFNLKNVTYAIFYDFYVKNSHCF